MVNSLLGVLPALVTPLAEDGSLNVRALEALLERCYSCEVHGVYLCGQTGEGLWLPTELRQQVCEVALRNAPAAAQTVVHVGAPDVRNALALARHADRLGAAAVSSLPPAGPTAFAEVRQYYRALASAVDRPVLVYYFPEFTRAIESLEHILELCRLPGVTGLKFTDFDLYRLGEVHRAGYTVFNGRDEVFAAGLLMGADGGIGSFYNLVPRAFVEIYAAAREQRWSDAQRLQRRVNELIRITLAYPLIAALKFLLEWIGIPAGRCARPPHELPAGQRHELVRELERHGFTKELLACGVVE